MARFPLKHYGLQLLSVLFLTACGGSGDGGGSDNIGTSVPTVDLSRIEITPSQPTLANGSVLDLTATGIYSDNSTRTLTSEVTWLSSNEVIASVSTSGKISTSNPGKITIQGSLDGVIGKTQLTVTNATLSRLEFSPAIVQLAKGTRQSLALIGYYSDGSTQDLVEQASLTVEDPSVANLTSPVISSDLWLTGLAVGNTTLDATLGVISTQIDVTITAANLVQLVISPESSILPLGTKLNLSVLGIYSDNNSQILTEQVNWSSTDSGILTVGASGLLQPQSVGNTTVTATLAGITGNHTASVSDAVLTAIEISTASNNIPAGNQQTLNALGHYSDGSLQDLTELVIWQSTPNDRLAISNVAGSRGQATALISGAVTVTTTLSGITGSLDLNISAATLDSIELTPLNTRLSVGTQSSISAIGRYSDGSINEISEQVGWTSSDFGIAIVSNLAGNKGQTLAISQGSTTVSATLDGVTGSASLVVTAAQLLSINVVPAEITLPAGTQQTVSARGSFSDGSVQILDDTVTWESDNPNYAVVNNGEISALQPGSARIIATWQKISGNASITISNATLSNLRINPASPALAIGTETQLQAIAVYSNGSEDDVTTQTTWSSADVTRLRAENSAGNQGRLVALASGNVSVTASFNSVQSNVTVSVGDAILTAVRITAASTSLNSAEQQQLMATGDFSDGSSQDLSSAVIWSSDSPTLAHISNNDADRGLVVAGINVSGTAIITASYKGLRPTQNLTINNTPKRPVSLVVLATPNVIRNDGIDTSNLEIRVQAASPVDTVADGTVVNLQISQAGTVISSQDLVTTSGVTSTSFTTTETGLLHIEANVVGTSLRNNTVLYASSTIYDVITGAGFANIQTSGNQILTGTRFGIFMFNLSNRTFPLLQYELRNGTDIIYSTTAAQDLNNNLFTGGSKVVAIYITEQDITDNGIKARFYLTDPASGGQFYFSVIFTTP